MHVFSGGNVQVRQMLGEPVEKTVEFLRGALEVRASAEPEGDALRVRVNLLNKAGHKLPTAFPSRRLWLHVTVKDVGRTVFESGAWDAARGEMAGGERDHQHYRVIRTQGEVMIYEAEYRDSAGAPTTSLLRAAGYRKDNRLLPRGFEAQRAVLIPAVGVEGDADFGGGSDVVEYLVGGVGRSTGWTVEVEALFQNIKPTYGAGMDPAFTARLRQHAGPVTISRAAVASRPGGPARP
jgi:hypothetical protein